MLWRPSQRAEVVLRAAEQGQEQEDLQAAQDPAYTHGGNLLLGWMAANCVVQRARAGKVKPGKKSKNARIDFLDCLVMAVDRLMRHHQEPSREKLVRHARLRGRRRDALRLFE